MGPRIVYSVPKFDIGTGGLWGQEPGQLRRLKIQLMLCSSPWKEFILSPQDFPSGAVVKNLPAKAGDVRNMSSIPGWRRSHRVGNGNTVFLPGKFDEQRSLAGYSRKESDITKWLSTHTHCSFPETAAIFQRCLRMCCDCPGSAYEHQAHSQPGSMRARLSSNGLLFFIRSEISVTEHWPAKYTSIFFFHWRQKRAKFLPGWHTY